MALQNKKGHGLKSVRMALFLREGIQPRDMVFLGLLMLGIISLTKLTQYAIPGGAAMITSNFWLYDLVVAVLIILPLRPLIGRWHGAEHMAIRAYVSSGATDIETISKQSRIDPKCGGRFFIGFILAQEFADVITRSLFQDMLILGSLLNTLSFFAMMEIILQIDSWKGLDVFPVTSQLSYYLQKYCTTAPPGMQELRTAQNAMEALIAAHEEEIDLPAQQ